MKMDQNDIDIDNFIKERVNSRRFYDPVIEPSPEFARRTMSRICLLESRRYLIGQYGSATFLALLPLILKYFWLWTRNDYFSLGRFPFHDFTVPTYRFIISFTGNLLLITIGVLFSVLFVLRSRRGEFSPSTKSAKIA